MKRFNVFFSRPLIPACGLGVVLCLHLVLTAWGDPLGRGFDFLLWGLASVLKILVWLSLLQTLPALYFRCSQSPRKAMLFSFSFALFLGVTILFLAQQRAFVSHVLSNDAIRYYPPTDAAIYQPAWVGFSQWLPRWHSGLVVGSEIGFAVMLALFHGLVGIKLGTRPLGAMVAGLVGTYLLGFAHWKIFGLVVWDYDVFHGDIVSGGFLLDLVIPVVTDPYTTVGCLVYSLFSLSIFLVFKDLEPDWLIKQVTSKNT